MCECKPKYKLIVNEIEIMKHREESKDFDYVFYTCDLCKKSYIEYPNIRKCPDCNKYICYNCDNIKYWDYNIENCCKCLSIDTIECNCGYHYCNNCKIEPCVDCDDDLDITCPKCNNVKIINGIRLCETHEFIRINSIYLLKFINNVYKFFILKIVLKINQQIPCHYLVIYHLLHFYI